MYNLQDKKNVIYLIKCPCNTWITEHRSAIKRNDVTSPASRHFNDKHKGASIFFIGIESVKTNGRGGNRNTIRKKSEAFWIYYLKSLFPSGLNKE